MSSSVSYWKEGTNGRYCRAVNAQHMAIHTDGERRFLVGGPFTRNEEFSNNHTTSAFTGMLDKWPALQSLARIGGLTWSRERELEFVRR